MYVRAKILLFKVSNLKEVLVAWQRMRHNLEGECTFWFLGSRVSECMPDQPRLFVLMVQACFSSTGASNSFLDYIEFQSELMRKMFFCFL